MTGVQTCVFRSPLDRIWELEFADGAFDNKGGALSSLTGGEGASGLKIVFIILAGIIVIVAIILTCMTINKAQLKKQPMRAYATTIPEIEAGLAKIPGQPRLKRIQQQLDKITEEGEE